LRYPPSCQGEAPGVLGRQLIDGPSRTPEDHVQSCVVAAHLLPHASLKTAIGIEMAQVFVQEVVVVVRFHRHFPESGGSEMVDF
jgi:hypothetical protein